jgi:hypothetical protein
LGNRRVVRSRVGILEKKMNGQSDDIKNTRLVKEWILFILHKSTVIQQSDFYLLETHLHIAFATFLHCVSDLASNESSNPP